MSQALDFRLSSGRAGIYREFGDPRGEPVFFFHGWPGESQQGVLLHRAALKRGIRVISPNRPGIGGADPQPERGLLDWPPVVAELADDLGLRRFRVLGLSGGGPYALACAWALGSRIRSCSTVCGALPAAPGPGRRYLSPVYRGMLEVHDRVPWLLQAALVPAVRVARIPPPRPVLWLGLRTLGPSDRELLWKKESFAQFYPAFRSAMQSGMSGLWQDGRPYAREWRFPFREIRCPVTVWHGTQDRNFSCAGARELAGGISQAVYRQTDDGHYSILSNQADAVLQDLTARG